MNKKVNTALFILGATVVNIGIMAVLVIAGLFVLSRLPESIIPIGTIVVFFVAIIGAFFIYHRIVKFISKRVNMDKYFDPIFRQKKKP